MKSSRGQSKREPSKPDLSKREQKTGSGQRRAADHSDLPLPAPLRGKWGTRAVLFAIVLLAYSDSFRLGLAQDSFAIITQDTRIRDVSAENLKLIVQKDYWWPKHADWLYRPVTTASFLFNYVSLGSGTGAAGYHWVNFLLHAFNIWLVYELALLLFQRAGPAFFAAALWALHPIAVESVTNIVGRADLLAAASVLGGLLLYARSGDRPGTGVLLALFAISAIGIFSKESAAVLIGLMLLWDISFRLDGIARRWPAYATVAASLVILWLVRQSVFSALPWPQLVYPDNMMQAADFFAARLTALKVIGLDLYLLVLPLQLSSDRSYNQIPISGASDPLAWLSLIMIAGLLVCAFWKRRQYPLFFFLTGFLGLTLLPTSNLLFLIKSIMAERFLYLPAVAFALAVAWLAYSLTPRHASVVLTVIVVLYGMRTYARNLDWKDNLTLALADVSTSPQSFRLHDTLAKSLFQQDSERNIDRSIQEQQKAWSILAPLPPEQSSDVVAANLGIYYAEKGALLGTPANARSRPWFEKSVATLESAREISKAAEKAFDDAQRVHGKPLSSRAGFSLLYFYLASVDMNLGRYAEALEALHEGRSIDPRFLDAYDNMGSAYLATGNPAQAVVALLEKGQLDGFSPSTLRSIQAVYGKLPDGACAVTGQGSGLHLNMACPRLRSDLCAASADLARAFTEARDSQQAAATRQSGAQTYGCAVP
jgi:protein O-mannosyl-transferase